jgi:hypothetical protein
MKAKKQYKHGGYVMRIDMFDQLMALFVGNYQVSVVDTYREFLKPYCATCIRGLEYDDQYCSRCGGGAGEAPARDPNMRFTVTLWSGPGLCYPPKFYGPNVEVAIEKAYLHHTQVERYA